MSLLGCFNLCSAKSLPQFHNLFNLLLLTRPCDARLIRDTPAPIPAPIAPPKSDGDDFDTPTIIEEEKEDSAAAESDDELDVIIPAEENIDNGLSGNSNFCGTTYLDASANCTREMHCPVSYLEVKAPIFYVLHGNSLLFLPCVHFSLV